MSTLDIQMAASTGKPENMCEARGILQASKKASWQQFVSSSHSSPS
jgi:hypothetical protein